eukprot:NODE_763_length_4425_cov_0.192094.p3 type:complete len:141 gc:universal NODE_763_length_4425_cov_0.192094:1184-762(-)
MGSIFFVLTIPIAKTMEAITICKTLFCAAASKNDSGIMFVTSDLKLHSFCSKLVFSLGIGTFGKLTIFTTTRPRNRAIVVTTSKYIILRSANLPNFFNSVACPAIPVVNVPKRRGTITVFIARRNTVANMSISLPKSGKK